MGDPPHASQEIGGSIDDMPLLELRLWQRNHTNISDGRPKNTHGREAIFLWIRKNWSKSWWRLSPDITIAMTATYVSSRTAVPKRQSQEICSKLVGPRRGKGNGLLAIGIPRTIGASGTITRYLVPPAEPNSTMVVALPTAPTAEQKWLTLRRPPSVRTEANYHAANRASAALKAPQKALLYSITTKYYLLVYTI